MRLWLDEAKRKTLLQVLALTSVENETVRELMVQLNPLELEVLYLYNEDAEEERYALKCPYCGQLFWDGDDDGEGIRVVDMDERWSSYFHFEKEARAIRGYYNDDHDLEWSTDHYECTACDKTVLLPQGMVEEGLG